MGEEDQLAIQTIRVLCAEMISMANSGHPGAPLGLASLGHVLFTRYLRFNPKNLDWLNRDRFILSNGHACTLQYVLLHLSGVLSLEDLKQFRQLGSPTPGHPEYGRTPGVEVTTGPLGQGIAAGVGMAIAQKHLNATFNTEEIDLFNARVFVVAGDGCMMEGISSEACSLAGHLGLSNLIVLYDSNRITIDGSTDLTFTENVEMRFCAYGFCVLHCRNGSEDIEELSKVIEKAIEESFRPCLIILNTIIGVGSVLEGSEKIHGNPLSKEDLSLMKEKYGMAYASPFYISESVRRLYGEMVVRGEDEGKRWDEKWKLYRKKVPWLSDELERRIRGELNMRWKEEFRIPLSPFSTRKANAIVFGEIAKWNQCLFGGSADLSPSNLTKWEKAMRFSATSYQGRYVHFGVREHAMMGISNGLAAHGLVTVFVSTFLVFLPYGLGAVRLAALSGHRVLYILTHDSIGVGEDGATHQPIEILSLLRSLPKTIVFRPADMREILAFYAIFQKNKNCPYFLCLSRQETSLLDGSSEELAQLGGYVLSDQFGWKVALVGTGTETSLCVEAGRLLQEKLIPVRVVSMPSTTLFDEQPVEYRRKVLGGGMVVSVEAMATFGWERYSHCQIGINSFGMSGKYREIYDEFGITPGGIATRIMRMLEEKVEGILPVLRSE